MVEGRGKWWRRDGKQWRWWQSGKKWRVMENDGESWGVKGNGVLEVVIGGGEW